MVNAISAGCGSSVGEKSRPVKSIMRLSGGSASVSRHLGRTIQARDGFDRAGRRNFLCRGSHLSLIAISIFEKMAGMELRSPSGIRGHFRNRLQGHRSSSRARLHFYSLALGKKSAAANVLLGSTLVSSHAWTHLFSRLRIALGA